MSDIETQPSKAIGYVRVSLDKQAEKGLSMEAQEEKIRGYAKLYNIEIVELVIDAGQSAKTLNRPGLQKSLDLLESGAAEALIVAKLDRLTRRVTDLGELIERYFSTGSFALLSVSEHIDTRSAAGRLVLHVLGSVSQWERETIGERTSIVMQHKISKGEYIGGQAPYGYRLTRDKIHLAVEPAEQLAIAEARRLRALGIPYYKISKHLAKAGFLSRVGTAFGAGQVQRMTMADRPTVSTEAA